MHTPIELFIHMVKVKGYRIRKLQSLVGELNVWSVLDAQNVHKRDHV